MSRLSTEVLIASSFSPDSQSPEKADPNESVALVGEDKNPKALSGSYENVLRAFEGQSHSRSSFATHA